MISEKPANTHSTRRNPNTGRIKTDVANTAFWEGMEYRISKELNIATGTTLTLKVVSPIDFILQRQNLTCDAQGFRLRVYRDTQGTEGGTFGTVEPIYKVNFMSEAPVVANQVTITSGGTFTPDGGQAAVETIRVKTAGATAQQSTVSGAVGDERGLPAGTYFLVFDNLGNAEATGVYDLAWEERA